MHGNDMKVETPLPLTELENRREYEGYDPSMSQCSNCGTGPLDDWYPVGDVVVIRHWLRSSVDVPGGGHYRWYCPEHAEKWGGTWYPNSHLAPADLLPEIVHPCAHVAGANTKCDQTAVEPFDGVWLCGQHAEVEHMNRRIAELMGVDED
ncbi:MAG: hypothetical protein JWN80_2104 [Microbacteriaceae bacterium]|nr:hypothetical protein [Microbacteriaceae bacterium]